MDKSETEKKTLIIANPISGYGQTERKLSSVVDIFRSRGSRVTPLITKKAGDAHQASGNFKGGLIVCMGGDGTFNEILNAVDLKKTLLAIIPAGTGNVLAKELRMPLNPLKAAQSIINGEIIHLDVGNANGRRFACACGAGLDAHIVRQVHENRAGNLTQLHYFPHFLKQLIPPKQWHVNVEVDGETCAQDVNLACVGNTKSYGGLAELTPHADPQDGLLDITAMRLGSLLDMLIPGVAALTHGLADCHYTYGDRGRHVKLKTAGENAPCHIDGDYAGMLPLDITIEPDRMQIIRPTEKFARDPLIPL